MQDMVQNLAVDNPSFPEEIHLIIMRKIAFFEFKKDFLIYLSLSIFNLLSFAGFSFFVKSFFGTSVFLIISFLIGLSLVYLIIRTKSRYRKFILNLA